MTDFLDTLINADEPVGGTSHNQLTGSMDGATPPNASPFVKNCQTSPVLGVTNVCVRTFTNVVTKERLDLIAHMCVSNAAFCVFTLVDLDMNKRFKTWLNAGNVPFVDVLEPLLDAFRSLYGVPPAVRPGYGLASQNRQKLKNDALHFSLSVSWLGSACFYDCVRVCVRGLCLCFDYGMNYMCVYVCMYVCVHVYSLPLLSTCFEVCLHVCEYVCVHAYPPSLFCITCVFICMSCMCIYMYTLYVYLYLCTICVCICMYYMCI